MRFLVLWMYVHFIRNTQHLRHVIVYPGLEFTTVSTVFKILESEKFACVTNELSLLYGTVSSSQSQILFNCFAESQSILVLI